MKVSAEFGDPNMLLFVAKLVNPGLLGMRIRTKKIKIIFTNNQITFNIFFPNVFF